MASNKIKQTNPNGTVIIYNYRDRLGDDHVSPGKNQKFEIDQIILHTVSLISLTTNKSKGNPAGTFEMRLAPTKNWVTAITPGSWCVILMSNEEIDDSAKYGGGRVDDKSFKMLGRIDSCRGVVDVDQVTGARRTVYMVQGKDWGTIFNSRFYVDPLNRSGQESGVGFAERFGLEEYLRKAVGYEPWKTGPKANEDSPATQRAQTPQSAQVVEETDSILTTGAQSYYNDFLGTLSSSFSDIVKPVTAPNLPVTADGVPTQNVQTDQPQTTGNAEKTKDSTIKLQSGRDSIEAVLKLWGRPDPATAAASDTTGILAKSQQEFELPKELADYMNFKDRGGNVSGSISQILYQLAGKLVGPDRYTDVDRSAGIINFETILGDNAIWQILVDNNNAPINELIPEIRFDTSGQAQLTLYNRVRPFTVKNTAEILQDNKKVGDNIGVDAKGSALAEFFLSPFKFVRTKEIELEDVITCNYGTNWRDKYNFIEINIDRSLFKEVYGKDVKLESQFRDEQSIGRDGLQSMMVPFQYIPQNDEGIQEPLSAFVYKYALKEWHFNTHKMLNGNMQLIGQNQYIQVGDNIRVRAEVLGPAKNISAAQKSSRLFTYLTAHVESISHTLQVDANGARSFLTSINFVRGVITDDSGNMIADAGNAGALDQDAELVTPTVEKNKATFGTSSETDPDRQKLRGK